MVFSHNGRLGVYTPSLLKNNNIHPCYLVAQGSMFTRPTPVLRLCTIVILPFLPLPRHKPLRGSKLTQNNLAITQSRNSPPSPPASLACVPFAPLAPFALKRVLPSQRSPCLNYSRDKPGPDAEWAGQSWLGNPRAPESG